MGGADLDVPWPQGVPLGGAALHPLFPSTGNKWTGLRHQRCLLGLAPGCRAHPARPCGRPCSAWAVPGVGWGLPGSDAGRRRRNSVAEGERGGWGRGGGRASQRQVRSPCGWCTDTQGAAMAGTGSARRPSCGARGFLRAAGASGGFWQEVDVVGCVIPDTPLPGSGNSGSCLTSLCLSFHVCQ